jgi:predicted DNA-binding transcriptional regulator AlpA
MDFFNAKQRRTMNPIAEFLTTKEAAALARVSRTFLEQARVSGTGPTFCKLGKKRVVYAHKDVVAWIEAQRRSSTSQVAAA